MSEKHCKHWITSNLIKTYTIYFTKIVALQSLIDIMNSEVKGSNKNPC